jgi:small subunit ribosomal protein S9
MAQANYIGRRKTSTARLYIKPGKGEFLVNKEPIEEYLPVKAIRNIALLPMHVTETEGKYDIKVTVRGGGKAGQAGAISHALARGLDGENEEMHTILKEHGLLTRDDRMVERKKPGQPKARKKFQFSKR